MNPIIYPIDDTIAVIYPTGELPIEEVAAKDVPAGTPYRIVEMSDIPSDRRFRQAWQADFSEPDGYGLGIDAFYASKEQEQ